MTHEARSVKTYSWLKISFYALTNKSLSINTIWPIRSHYYANHNPTLYSLVCRTYLLKPGVSPGLVGGGDHDYSDTDSGLGAGVTPSPLSTNTPGGASSLARQMFVTPNSSSGSTTFAAGGDCRTGLYRRLWRIQHEAVRRGTGQTSQRQLQSEAADSSSGGAPRSGAEARRWLGQGKRLQV